MGSRIQRRLLPTLFLCYINELCQLNIKNCKITTYADDTALTFHAGSIEELFDTAQVGFTRVCRWLASNLLTLNGEKTKYIAYSIINKSNMPPYPSLIAHKCKDFGSNSHCECPQIERTDKIKYLGVIIDKNLNFEEHIHMVQEDKGSGGCHIFLRTFDMSLTPQ